MEYQLGDNIPIFERIVRRLYAAPPCAEKRCGKRRENSKYAEIEWDRGSVGVTTEKDTLKPPSAVR